MTPPTPTKKPKRGFALYLLILASLIIAWSGALRVQQTLTNIPLIKALELQTRIPFLIASGIAYCLLGLFAAVGLFLRWSWAPWSAPLAWFLATLLYWINHLLLTRSPAASVSIPFKIMLNIFLFLSALFVLALPKQQIFFNFHLTNPFAKKG